MEPKFEYALTIKLELGPRKVVGNSPLGGQRGYVEVIGGTFEGPKLKGIVLPGGGDWPYIQPDGVIKFDARYILKEQDGTEIYVRNSGFRWGTPEVMKKLAEYQPVDMSEYYMRATPTFEVQEGPHDWLNKYLFFGIGERSREGNVIHYYKLL